MRLFSLALFLFLTACDVSDSLGLDVPRPNWGIHMDPSNGTIKIRASEVDSKEKLLAFIDKMEIFEPIINDLPCEKESMIIEVDKLVFDSKYDFKIRFNCAEDKK